MNALVVLAALFLVSSSAWAADPLAFSRRGKAVSTLDRAAIEALVTPETVKVFEFHQNKERAYRAIDLKKLFDKVYGEGWRKEEDVVFRCADGFEPVLPVELLLTREPWLAVDTADGDAFAIAAEGSKAAVPFGPFYLIWKNLGKPSVLADGARDWPYQVVAVDFLRFADKYPKLAPPAHANRSVREGFALYRAHCANCHTLNGEGATAAGVELNRPVSVARYWRRDYLLQWIENPAKVRETAKMPPYVTSTTHPLPKVEERRQIENIVRYLEAMAK